MRFVALTWVDALVMDTPAMEHKDGSIADSLSSRINELNGSVSPTPISGLSNALLRRKDLAQGTQKPNDRASMDVAKALLTEMRTMLTQLREHQVELEVQNEELRRKNSHLESSRARSLELLEMAGELAKVGGWELDLRSNDLFWNKETCRIHELDEFESPTLEQAIDFYSPEARPFIRAAVEQAIAVGTPWDLELQLVTKKGRTIWVRAQGVAVSENGEVIKLRGAFQDITERKQTESSNLQLESQLRESQKMEAIGTLASGIAHDFNNILTAIMGNTDVAILSLDDPATAAHCLEEVSKASERARELVRQILSFSRTQATERKLMSIVPVVEESILLLRASLPARVELTLECATQVPMVLADATQIEQVVLNLATNAFQAMAGRPGKIHIQIDSVSLDEVVLDELPQLRNLNCETKRLVRLVVSDDGLGMTTVTASRIFEPFFTTKPIGEGTGLGLAVVHGIVRTHEGAITVDSQPGEGAVFTIYLPAHDDVPLAKTNCNHNSESNVRRMQMAPKHHILYVDDDPAVMQSILGMLKHQGFLVTGMSDPVEAMYAIQSDPTRFDLIVTDYNMPRQSGIEFASFARKLRADLPIVIITGLIDETLQVEAERIGVQELIPKPFSLNTLCSALHRIVQSAAISC